MYQIKTIFTMSKLRNSIQKLRANTLSPHSLSQVKGGGKTPYDKALKIQKKLMKEMGKKKLNDKKIMKYQDELSCLGFANLGCCGNGNGSW